MIMQKVKEGFLVAMVSNLRNLMTFEGHITKDSLEKTKEMVRH